MLNRGTSGITSNLLIYLLSCHQVITLELFLFYTIVHLYIDIEGEIGNY